jgi:hypothetical protein
MTKSPFVIEANLFQRIGSKMALNCLECAKLRRENERLQALLDRIKEEIDLIEKQKGSDDTPQKADS